MEIIECRAGKKWDSILEPAQIVVSINNLPLYIAQTGCPHHNFWVHPEIGSVPSKKERTGLTLLTD
jgi:hypothetical protein